MRDIILYYAYFYKILQGKSVVAVIQIANRASLGASAAPFFILFTQSAERCNVANKDSAFDIHRPEHVTL